MTTPTLDRRRLLLAAAAGGIALSGAGALPRSAAAATDDELAYANFGAATELLLRDYYAKLREAKLYRGSLANAFARARVAAGEHVAALSTLLTDSAQTPPLEEDFEFVWPAATFKTKKPAATAGLTIVETLLGVYLTAAATSPTEPVRVLFSSLAASLGEQRAALSLARGRSAIGNALPTALDLESASARIEAFLG